MRNDYCLSCDYLFKMSVNLPGEFEYCHKCPLPLLLLNTKGDAIRANHMFAALFDADLRATKLPSRYNIFKDQMIRAHGQMESVESAFEGETVTISVPQCEFPANLRSGETDDVPADSVNITVQPIIKESRVEAVGLVYHGVSVEKKSHNWYNKPKQIATFAQSAVDLKHEINNPLLLITGNVQLMLTKPDELTPGTKRKLEKIQVGAEKIHDILEHFRVATNAFCLEQEVEPTLK